MTTAPTEDEFAIWRDNPITAWVMAGVQRFADLQKPAFAEMAWHVSDERQEWDEMRLARARIKARADAYEGLAGLTYEQAQGLHETPAMEAPDA